MTRSSKTSTLKAWGNKLAESNWRKRALVAAARKCALIASYDVVNATEFRLKSQEATA